jgi:serine/threonine protein kinase
MSLDWVTQLERPPSVAGMQVCDFGLSRSLDLGRTHLRTAAVGSVSHMAPETLLRGEMRREADVYAFGVLRELPRGPEDGGIDQ